jgi:hypothetical protein
MKGFLLKEPLITENNQTGFIAELAGLITNGYIRGGAGMTPEVITLPFANITRPSTAIFGVYKEITEYSGPAFRAKRAADSVEQDISFLASGWVDMASYAAFGTGSEKIVKIYDQSGNGIDLAQTDVTKCGTLETSSYSGKPVLHCPAGSKYVNVGYSDWTGKAHWNFVSVMKLRTTANVAVFSEKFGAMSTYISAAAPNYNTHFSSWFSETNVFNRASGLAGMTMRFRYDQDGGSNALQARLYKNGIERTASSTTAHNTVMGAGFVDLVFHEGTTESGDAEYSTWAYIGHTIQDSDWASMESKLRTRYFPFTDYQIHYCGDSLTVQNGIPDAALRWSNIVTANLETATGQQWDTFSAGAIAQEPGAETDRVFQLFRDAVVTKIDTNRRHAVVVNWCATNDFAAGDTVADAQSGTVSLAQEAAAWGATPFYLNMLPRNDLGAGNAAFESKRLQYNDELELLLEGIAVAVDVASIPELQNPADTTYYYDGVHITAAGSALIAAAVTAAIRAYFGF